MKPNIFYFMDNFTYSDFLPPGFNEFGSIAKKSVISKYFTIKISIQRFLGNLYNFRISGRNENTPAPLGI